MKINKHVVIFSSLFLLLVAGYFLVLTKFFPILVHHTFYYCREMAKAIFLNLPNTPGNIVFGLLSISAFYTLFRLFGTAFQVYRFRQTLSKSITQNRKFALLLKALGLADKVLVLRDAKPYAYCFGLHNPKIFVSTGLLAVVEENELKIVLRHEKYHLEHKDNLTLLLARFIESLFPFFPILSDLISMYKIDRELLADKASINTTEDKISLASLLKKLLEYEPTTAPLLASAIADDKTLETRIRALLSMTVTPHRFERKNLIFSTIFIVMLILLVGTPVNAVEWHKNGLDALLVCNKNVSCESICKNPRALSIQNIMSSSVSKSFSDQNEVFSVDK